MRLNILKNAGALLLAFALILLPSISQAKFSGSSGGSSHSYSSYSSHSYSGGGSYSSHSSSYGSYYKPSSSGGGSSYSYSKPAAPTSTYSYSKPNSGSSGSSSYASSGSGYSSRRSFTASTSTYSGLNSYSHQYRQAPITVNHNYYSSPMYSHVYSTYGSGSGYYTARQRDMGGWYARYPRPAYIGYMHPNYGIYDTYFLSLLLMNAMQPSYAGWAYAHQTDPSYLQWQADMQQQAASNAQVATQLATLNAQVAALNASHATPMAQDALPTGVTPDVAISPSAVAQDPNLTPEDTGPGFWGWTFRILATLGVLGALAWVAKIFLFPSPKPAARW